MLWADTIPKNAKVGRIFKVNLNELRPTQMAFGMMAVYSRAMKLASAKKEKELDAYAYRKRALGVLGLGQVFPVNGHHFSRAMLLVKEEQGYLEVVENLNAIENEKEFWAEMERLNFVYLLDGEGKKKSIQDLPPSLSAMTDDPYRSLAWLVKKAKGFKERKEIKYQEFEWAEYFRAKIPHGLLADDYWIAAFGMALEISHNESASHLPGYTGSVLVDSAACAMALEMINAYRQHEF